MSTLFKKERATPVKASPCHMPITVVRLSAHRVGAGAIRSRAAAHTASRVHKCAIGKASLGIRSASMREGACNS